ncbi:MAG: replication-associated recombination protein A [Candidatus Sumerlaeia bacterium]|nr:replication-associated recombination protein A [Candidatus Sumerlaeia bacterium]
MTPEQDDLFAPEPPPQARPGDNTAALPGRDDRPLAERMRPRALADYLGQEDLVGDAGPLTKLIRADRIPSMVLWGPPGSGKTTLAGLIANEVSADFVPLSAVTAAIKDVRAVVDAAKSNRRFGRRTILFIDELHRFNKAQQDAFLPHVESGLVTFIGATTENPSFSVFAPLLSRCRVFVLKAHGPEVLGRLLRRGLDLLNREEPPIAFADAAFDAVANLSDGDARRALGLLELVASIERTADAPGEVTPEKVRTAAQRHYLYDRSGEEHFNLISALHKTLRSSDPHGALYWLARMLKAGEDPRYVARRMVRFASEDIGLAHPPALSMALSALDAYERLGSPEGELALAECCLYLALAPKSNSTYRAYKDACALVDEGGALPVPLDLRNAPTGLMKQIGYGKEYTYDHDAEGAFEAKQGLPKALHRRRLYRPGTQGWEGARAEQLAQWDAARDALEPKE